MYHKFQRKIPTVGGRLSPWVDEEEWRSRQNPQNVAKNPQDSTENAPKDGEKSVEDLYWQKKKKQLQVEINVEKISVFQG